MQAAMQAGKAYVDSPGGVATVIFDDSYKQGDKLSLAVDTAAKKIRSYDVNTYTYLDDAKEEQTDSKSILRAWNTSLEPLSQD
jgi:hypothetical protein